MEPQRNFIYLFLNLSFYTFTYKWTHKKAENFIIDSLEYSKLIVVNATTRVNTLRSEHSLCHTNCVNGNTSSIIDNLVKTSLDSETLATSEVYLISKIDQLLKEKQEAYWLYL